MHTVFSEEMFLLAYTSINEGKVQFVLFGFVCSRRVLAILSSSCAEAILPYPLNGNLSVLDVYRHPYILL